MAVLVEALMVRKGIITVRWYNGHIVLYAQRGIHKLTPDEQCFSIETDIIDPNAFKLKELPDGVKLIYNNGQKGRPVANFYKRNLYKETMQNV